MIRAAPLNSECRLLAAARGRAIALGIRCCPFADDRLLARLTRRGRLRQFARRFGRPWCWITRLGARALDRRWRSSGRRSRHRSRSGRSRWRTRTRGRSDVTAWRRIAHRSNRTSAGVGVGNRSDLCGGPWRRDGSRRRTGWPVDGGSFPGRLGRQVAAIRRWWRRRPGRYGCGWCRRR